MTEGFGIVFFVFWVIMMLGSIAAGVFFLIITCKVMKALQLMASSMQQIAITFEAKTEEKAGIINNIE